MSYRGFLDEIRKIPPVTRFLCVSWFAVSVPVMLELLSPYQVKFVPKLVIQRFELWRIWSSFFVGRVGFSRCLSNLFDLVMLYRSSNALELDRYSRRSPDYAWQLTLAAGAIIVLNLPLDSFVFMRPLTLCILYLSSALAPAGYQTFFMGLITIPVEYLPYAMIGARYHQYIISRTLTPLM